MGYGYYNLTSCKEVAYAIIKLLGFDELWSEVKKGTIEDYLIEGRT